MPSEKILNEKKKIVEDLNKKLTSAVAGVIVDYKGITVEADTKLRKELREAGVDYFVAKNTLLKLATKDTSIEGLNEAFQGTTAVALHDSDYTSAARILEKYASDKETDFAIKSGFIDGEVVEIEKIVALAKIPSKEVLLAQVLGGLNSTLSGLAIALNAVKEKLEAEGGAA
jgi:large subunit ribosomal protein L10